MRNHFTEHDLPLAIFLASAVIGIIPAYDRALSLPALSALLGFGVLYIAISRLAHSRARWEEAALTLTGMTALVSIYYVTQLGHMGFEAKIAPIARAAAVIAQATPDLAFWKPLGNTIGTFVEGSLFVILGMILVERRPAHRALLVACLGVSALALLFSSSRGAWVAVFAAGLLWAALYWKPARWFALVGGASLAGLALFSVITGDVQGIGEIPLVGASLGALFNRPDRLDVYYNSLVLIQDVPITGIGLGGQFGMVYSRYALLLHVPFLYNAHNLFLEIWLEQGLLGITAWVWLAVTIFTVTRRFPSAGHPRLRIRFESTWIGLAAILFHGLTDARQFQALLVWLPFFWLLGLNAALLLSRRFRPAEKDGWLRYLPIGAGAACLAFGLFSAWPLPAALLTNRAALIQHRADLTKGLSPELKKNMLDESAGLYRRALEIDPANRTANQRLGLIALSRREFDQAVLHLNRAYTADARIPGTRRALGLAYTFTGRLDEAAPLLRGQLDVIDELNYWGRHYTSGGLTEAGHNALHMSLQLNPNQPEIHRIVNQGD